MKSAKNNKLIYISFIKLTDKVSRDWYIDYCIEKGATIEYWDIVSLVRESHEENGALNTEYLRQVKNYREFEDMLKNPENTGAVYVMLLSYSARFSKPFRLLSKYNCKMVFLSWGAMPTSVRETKLQRIVNFIFCNPIRSFKNFIDLKLGALLRKLKIVNRFDLVFAAGKVLNSFDQHAKKIISFNLCDFDHYARVKFSDVRYVKGKYAVFLDINLPFQSDLKISGLPVLDSEVYFSSLNRFFTLLEKNHDIKIVVAVHPKAAYGNDVFEQRECYRMLTAELIKNADFVITHQSTALSYAVLNIKPVIFIYTDEMVRIYKNTIVRETECLALYLNSKIYNVDGITDGSQICIQHLSQKDYELYKYNYLTSPESENRLSAEIFWNEINALLR